MSIQERIKNPRFFPGAIRDIPDDRDFQFQEIAFGVAPFDWSKGYDIETVIGHKLAVKDQGQSGSCGGQAWSNYGDALTAALAGETAERSAKFIYAQTFVPGGGSAGRTNCEFVINQGWGLEANTSSYESGNPPSEAFMERVQDITEDARKAAKQDTAVSYANVGSTNIDEVAQAISMNHGVILGVDGQNNGTWLAPNPQPPTTQNGLWAHWVYAGKARIKDGKKQIGFLNSWGATVGEGGWQWLNEDYFTKGFIFSCWTLLFNTHGVSKPNHVFNTNLKFGDIGGEVQLLQQALQYLSIFPATVKTTTFYGPLTKASVFKFQQLMGLVDDGSHFGPKTRQALNLALQ